MNFPLTNSCASFLGVRCYKHNKRQEDAYLRMGSTQNGLQAVFRRISLWWSKHCRAKHFGCESAQPWLPRYEQWRGTYGLSSTYFSLPGSIWDHVWGIGRSLQLHENFQYWRKDFGSQTRRSYSAESHSLLPDEHSYYPNRYIKQ